MGNARYSFYWRGEKKKRNLSEYPTILILTLNLTLIIIPNPFTNPYHNPNPNPILNLTLILTLIKMVGILKVYQKDPFSLAPLFTHVYTNISECSPPPPPPSLCIEGHLHLTQINIKALMNCCFKSNQY